MNIFQPIASSSKDGEDMTLYKILEAVSGNGFAWDNIAFTNDGSGNPTQIVFSKNETTFLTLNLTWSGGFITNIAKS